MAGMRIEVVALVSKTSMAMNARTFAKLLHVARANGWVPSRALADAPTPLDDDDDMLLPRFSPYLESFVSPHEAASLRKALVRACATGAIAAEKHLDLAASALMHLICEGPFEVRLHPVDHAAEMPLQAA